MTLSELDIQIAKRIVREYYSINDKIPSTVDLDSIASIVESGSLRRHHIETWDEFLLFCELPILHPKKIKYSTKLGYLVARNEILEFYKKHNKVPTTKDFEKIYFVIYKGRWKKFGIHSWNQFLLSLNLTTNKGSKWKGIKGLTHAVSIITQHIIESNEYPEITDYPNIFQQINLGNWNEFGINTWVDLIDYCEEQNRTDLNVKFKIRVKRYLPINFW